MFLVIFFPTTWAEISILFFDSGVVAAQPPAPKALVSGDSILTDVHQGLVQPDVAAGGQPSFKQEVIEAFRVSPRPVGHLGF